MDLWDMTKLLFRRWYISLSVLLLCAVGVLFTVQSVSPDYVATGHVTLIPPSGESETEGEASPIRNPWWDLGYHALGNATILDVTSKDTLERLVAEGYTDSVAVELQMSTVFRIEAVGVSEEQATATVQQMMRLIESAVTERQAALDVIPGDRIRTLPLDDGSAVEARTSKITRVLVVAAGVSLMFMVGVTIGVDALLRRRSARGAAKTTATGSAPVAPVAGAAAASRVVQSDVESVTAVSNGHESVAVPVTPGRTDADATIVLPRQPPKTAKKAGRR